MVANIHGYHQYRQRSCLEEVAYVKGTDSYDYSAVHYCNAHKGCHVCESALVQDGSFPLVLEAKEKPLLATDYHPPIGHDNRVLGKPQFRLCLCLEVLADLIFSL
jgi:hypothetical protein